MEKYYTPPDLDETISSRDFNSFFHSEKEVHQPNSQSKEESPDLFFQQKLILKLTVFTWRCFLPLLTWVLFLSMRRMHLMENWRLIPFLLYVAPLAFSSQSGRALFPTHTFSFMSFLAKGLNLKVNFMLDASNESDSTRKSTKGSRNTDNKGRCNFVLGMHPHGKYPANIVPWLEELKHTSTKTEKFEQLENVKLAQSSLGKFIPTVSYPTTAYGAIDVTRKSICAALARNESVALFPGGAREMTFCQPFAKVMKLMKRSGFLRLAWKQVHEEDKDLKVLPVFLFGMNDAYFNPLDTLDQFLFNKTGINIPLWLPTKITDFHSDNVMVIGRALDPKDYKDPSALVSAYYTELQSIFDANKHKCPAYKDRSIVMVAEARRSKKKSSVLSIDHLIVAVGVPFITATLYYSQNGGSWFLSSVAKTAKESFYSKDTTDALRIHIISASIWTIGSGLQFSFKSKKSPTHKVLGFISMTSAICVNVTAVAVCLLRSNDIVQQIQKVPEIFYWKSVITAAHIIGIQLLANMAVSLSTTTMVSDSMKALRNSDYKKHGKLLKNYNGVLITNLFPRVISKVFRYEFPFFSREVNYTLAVAVMWYFQYSFIKDKPHLASRMKRVVRVSLFALLVYPCLNNLLLLHQNHVYTVSFALTAFSLWM